MPRISNYTDFEALAHEPDVDLQYVEKPEPTEALDMICLPGTKSTIADLDWLRDSGWDQKISTHYRAGGSILGICGGYQMLGRIIADPDHVESSASEVSGLDMLAIETFFAPEKVTASVTAVDASGIEVSGYEIHCGRVINPHHRIPFRVRERNGYCVDEPEGALSDDGRVLGTSIHGLLDGPVFRRHYLNQIRERKGLPPLRISDYNDAKSFRMRAYNRVADLIANNLDVSSLAALVGVNRLLSLRSIS